MLERLAYADSLLCSPIPTIRDVAEATDASPKVIARILTEMRGVDDSQELRARLDDYEKRLSVVEQRPVIVNHYYVQPDTVQSPATPPQIDPAQKYIWDTYVKWLNGQPSTFSSVEEESLAKAVNSLMIVFSVIIVAVFVAWCLGLRI